MENKAFVSHPTDDAGDQGQPSDFSDSIFARRLREVRQQAGMTQQQLADRMAEVGHKLHRSAVAKIELGERPVTIGEAVQLAGVLGIPLMELVTQRGGETDLERRHAERVEAQIAVRSLKHEVAERHRLLLEQQVLCENAASRLARAEARLSELGGELPWNSLSFTPGIQTVQQVTIEQIASSFSTALIPKVEVDAPDEDQNG